MEGAVGGGGEAPGGKVVDDRRQDGPVAAFLEAFLVVGGDGLEVVLPAPGGAAFRTSCRAGLQVAPGAPLEVDRHRGRDAEDRAAVHLPAAARVGLGEDDATAQAVQAGENGGLDRQGVQAHEQAAAGRVLDGQVAGMDVEARKVGGEVGEGDEAGQDAEVGPVRGEGGAQGISPFRADRAPALAEQGDPGFASLPVEGTDVDAHPGQPEGLGQGPGAALLRAVGGQHGGRPGGRGGGSPAPQHLLGIAAAAAEQNDAPGRPPHLRLQAWRNGHGPRHPVFHGGWHTREFPRRHCIFLPRRYLYETNMPPSPENKAATAASNEGRVG
jgi:hypothetical protein